MTRKFIKTVSFSANDFTDKTEREIADIVFSAMNNHNGDYYSVYETSTAVNVEVLTAQYGQCYLDYDDMWFQPTLGYCYTVMADSVIINDPDALLTRLYSRGSVFTRFVKSGDNSFIVFFIPKDKYDLIPQAARQYLLLDGIVLGYWNVSNSGYDQSSAIRSWDFPLVSDSKPVASLSIPDGQSIDVTLGPQAAMIDLTTTSGSGSSIIAIAVATWSIVTGNNILGRLWFDQSARTYGVTFAYVNPNTGSLSTSTESFNDRSNVTFHAKFNNEEKSVISSAIPHCLGMALKLDRLGFENAWSSAILSREGYKNTTAVVTSQVNTLQTSINAVAADLQSEANRLQQYTDDKVATEAQVRASGDVNAINISEQYADTVSAAALAAAKEYTDSHSGDSGDYDSLYVRG